MPPRSNATTAKRPRAPKKAATPKPVDPPVMVLSGDSITQSSNPDRSQTQTDRESTRSSSSSSSSDRSDPDPDAPLVDPPNSGLYGMLTGAQVDRYIATAREKLNAKVHELLAPITDPTPVIISALKCVLDQFQTSVRQVIVADGKNWIPVSDVRELEDELNAQDEEIAMLKEQNQELKKRTGLFGASSDEDNDASDRSSGGDHDSPSKRKRRRTDSDPKVRFADETDKPRTKASAPSHEPSVPPPTPEESSTMTRMLFDNNAWIKEDLYAKVGPWTVEFVRHLGAGIQKVYDGEGEGAAAHDHKVIHSSLMEVFKGIVGRRSDDRDAALWTTALDRAMLLHKKKEFAGADRAAAGAAIAAGANALKDAQEGISKRHRDAFRVMTEAATMVNLGGPSKLFSQHLSGYGANAAMAMTRGGGRGGAGGRGGGGRFTAMSKRQCHKCGKTGHIQANCRSKDPSGAEADASPADPKKSGK